MLSRLQASFQTFSKLYNWQLTFKKIKFEPKNPVRRRGKAISFFLRHGGVLKISRGVEHDPEAERDGESSKNFDLKNRFSFGNVPTANFFQKSPTKFSRHSTVIRGRGRNPMRIVQR